MSWVPGTREGPIFIDFLAPQSDIKKRRFFESPKNVTERRYNRPWDAQVSILIRSAQPADQLNYLRPNSLRQLKLETPFCRLYRAQTPRPTTQAQGPKGPKGQDKGTKGPKGPKGPKGTKGTQGTQRDPRDPKGSKGTKGAFGALGGNGAHGALWGYSAAIPSGKPFRVEGDSERKAIPIGWLFRADGQSEWKVISRGTQGDPRGPKGT